jgi:hypothetical protein
MIYFIVKYNNYLYQCQQQLFSSQLSRYPGVSGPGALVSVFFITINLIYKLPDPTTPRLYCELKFFSIQLSYNITINLNFVNFYIKFINQSHHL